MSDKIQNRTEKIAEGSYWVGGVTQESGLNCNPYLLVDGDEAILIDPGSVLDFDDVYNNVCSIVPIEKIKYVILHHQDPDFCASVPLFEKKGAKFTIITHWRTQVLLKYYGIKSDYYIINKNELKLTLQSGKTLDFILTPYLHFPGSFTTYDPETKVLFSSDLFGAFSFNWNLYAKEDYIEKMKTFHEHYMPSNSILRVVMESFLAIDIEIIAPQHGSIINQNIKQHIKVLRDLECGSFLNPIKRNLAKSGGYMSICTLVLKRFAAIFSQEELENALTDVKITYDENMNITDYNYTGTELWNLIFERVLEIKGLQWLMIIEPFVETLSKEYDISMPSVFESIIKKAESKVINLSEENRILHEINLRLKKGLQESESKLIRCSVTGMYNFEFFKTFLSDEINNILESEISQNPGLMIISLDSVEKIEYYYGSDEVDGTLKNLVFILENSKAENDIIFRLQGYSFALYVPLKTKESCISLAEHIRNEVASSGKFIENITVSIGVAWLDEVKGNSLYAENPGSALFNTASMRVRLAGYRGHNTVFSSTAADTDQDQSASILIVDSDEISKDIIKITLENLNYKVITASDGDEAWAIAEQSAPLLIISEIMLPKKDGFLLRENLLANSNTKIIPFIFLSHLKNEESVVRAYSLEVEHYFKKPFILAEVVGVIKNQLKGASYR